MWRQGARQLPVPETRIDGQRVLVTGGNGGIGLAVAEGLRDRGADVVIACRNSARARAAVERLRARPGAGQVDSVACALDDQASVVACVDRLSGGPAFDRVVLNAGVWPKRYAETKQGHEIAFGVNVLGHALLADGLLAANLVSAGSRFVWVTGDIYIMSKACSPAFRYRSMLGGQQAYCRSKLGNLWLCHVYAQRHSDCGWYAAHPGVVSTRLAGDGGPAWLRRWLMVTPAEGARTVLTCATDPELPPGYLHNTLGRMELHPADPGANTERAEALFETCRELNRPFVHAGADRAA